MAREHQDLALGYRHADAAGTFLRRETRVGEALQAHVEGQRDRLAGTAVVSAELANDAAKRIDLDLAGAGGAAQHLVVLALDAALADPHVGQLEQRVARQVLLGDGSDIAGTVHDRRTERIRTREADLDLHARQAGRVELDPAHLFPGEVVADRHRHERALPADLAHHPATDEVLDLDHFRKCVERQRHVADLLRHHDDAIVLLVVCEDLAVAVVDHAPRRRQQAKVDAVVVGELLVLRRLDHLQVVHAADQRGEQQELAAGEQRRTPAEQLAAVLVLVLPARHQCTTPRWTRTSTPEKTGNSAMVASAWNNGRSGGMNPPRMIEESAHEAQAAISAPIASPSQTRR